MRNSISAAITLSTMALLTTTPSIAEETNKCGLTRYASLDLVVVGETHLLVPVTIQDTPAYMTLSLANPFSGVSEKAVRDLSLTTQPTPSRVGVYTGRKEIRATATAHAFAMGNVRIKNASFLVLPDSGDSENTSEPPVIGFLGMDVFNGMDIELDVAHRKLNLFSQDHCPGHVVYWSQSFDSAPIRFGSLGEFYFPMELDGKKLETTLATSNAMTTLRTDATRKLFNFDSHSDDIETESDKAGHIVSHYRAMKLSGEGLDIINARISLIDPPTAACHLSSRQGAASYEGCFGVHPLQLGQNVVSKLHFFIATKEKMLYFTLADPSEKGDVAAPVPTH